MLVVLFWKSQVCMAETSLLKATTFIIQTTMKIPFLLSCMKRSGMLPVPSRRLFSIMITIDFWVTKIFLWREKQKASVAVIKQGLENRIDFSFCADNLFYLTFYHTIYCIPNFICMHVDLYKLDCRHLMGTRPVFMSFWWA